MTSDSSPPSIGQAQAMLSKTFDPAAIEARWYAHWEANGRFRPDRPDAQPFTIVNPPPNVTGSLHIGHALDNTLQDIIIRYERLRGKDALWVVGTDHAGIATQMVVERQMAERGEKRTDMTPKEFAERVWEWKAESGGTITGQLRRLGCSMDWSREQFTMDPHFSKAVTKVFVDLYNEGLIYRDKRLVNWDPALKTAISDLEVETRDVAGHFWTFRYPLADGVTLDDGGDFIEIATTRPETMLADMAVAVHPDDPRYTSVIGKEVVLPITGRRIPIVPDQHADPELGSGAVKITPGHDFNDFEVGKRAGIEPADMLNMLNEEARVCQTLDGRIPDELIGLDRFDARRRVVAMMDELGLLAGVEERTIATPFGDRGGVVIEPWLTDQWYVDAKKLAAPAIEAVKSGAIEIIPKSWEKTFFNWMENIQPWCISRQLWWGHQVPVWYGPRLDGQGHLQVGDIIQAAAPQGELVATKRTRMDDQPLVGATKTEILSLARTYYPAEYEIAFADEPSQRSDNKTIYLRQDPDVLDTWFSSALWPFATLGWPDEDAPLYDKHYPNDLLISGFDILFFWDARMAMMGRKLTGQNPWKRLYLHGLVRAADGQKMSKSKGNVVDPLVLIDRFGADALRFFMAAMESQGRDVKMDERRVEGYRNFATKLWNATRFCQTNGIGASQTLTAPTAQSAVNRWIIGEVVETLAQLDRALADLRFDAAANAIYHFAWDRFCDWYLELIKPASGGRIDAETRDVAGWVLDQILVMLHPFMPFITEELWHAQGAREADLIVAHWPEPQAAVAADAKNEVDWLIALTTGLRGAKNDLGLPPGAMLTAFLEHPSPVAARILAQDAGAVERVARLSNVEFRSAPAGAAMQVIAGEDVLVIPLEGVIDIAAERARLQKAHATSEKEAAALAKRLDNPSFVEKARPEAVDKARADHAHHLAEAERLTQALARLG
ncbi:valine--tRNA ligase [Croceicoccus sp. F390]|uniref:Valine--tRNA ligase n=1 Tax=Croceicoccus esteveae TaxID=3075597 RepID=A0ABU2ZGU4_9SPHN|nr:valine--tRNA ligase [Croceicoccus sp. F390]MDT0574637.1 valine--tRNA ligase [Croceicoccus sp. F390]